MAVTQQLARCSPELVATCQSNVTALDDLCSFRLLPSDHHLDLDWAPKPLEDLASLAGAPQLTTCLQAATSGGEEVNPEYRDFPFSVWEHPVTFHPPAKVADLAEVLLAHSDFPTRAHDHLASLQTELEPNRRAGYLAEHYSALTTFYAAASTAGQSVVLWWD